MNQSNGINKFERGNRVVHIEYLNHGVVLGSFRDLDNQWYVVWRVSSDQLFISLEAKLDWYPKPPITILPDTEIALPGTVSRYPPTPDQK